MKRILASATLLLLVTALEGCGRTGPPALQLTDITGAQFGRDFELTDHNGRVRTLADFRGKVVTVFFGFTHCPDVCPTVLAEMAQVMRELGPDADKVQVLFVTVDPERDTPEVLRRYVPAFYPGFLGLYGDADAIARTAREFKIVYQKQALPGGGYSVDHSAGTYIYDPRGRLRLYASYGSGAAKLLHDIRILLRNS
ncbi:MAG: SCO family protein [Burkholderiales bacterium]